MDDLDCFSLAVTDGERGGEGETLGEAEVETENKWGVEEMLGLGVVDFDRRGVPVIEPEEVWDGEASGERVTLTDSGGDFVGGEEGLLLSDIE